jgi:hypothetical protein
VQEWEMRIAIGGSGVNYKQRCRSPTRCNRASISYQRPSSSRRRTHAHIEACELLRGGRVPASLHGDDTTSPISEPPCRRYAGTRVACARCAAKINMKHARLWHYPSALASLHLHRPSKDEQSRSLLLALSLQRAVSTESAIASVSIPLSCSFSIIAHRCRYSSSSHLRICTVGLACCIGGMGCGCLSAPKEGSCRYPLYLSWD